MDFNNRDSFCLVRRWIFEKLLGLSLLFVLTIAGCVQNSTVTTSSSLTVSGSIQVPDQTADYRFLALSTTGEATIVSIVNGRFSMTLASGDYSFVLLDSNNQQLALLTQNGDTIFSVNDPLDFQVITVDLALATLSSPTSLSFFHEILNFFVKTAYALEIDLTDLINIDVTKSGGGNGIDVTKPDEFSALTHPNDVDQDLVPNWLDNDNNQNGVFDTVEGLEPCIRHITPVVGNSQGIADLQETRCFLFDNLKLQSTALFNGDGDPLPHTADHIIAIHLVVPTALVALIQSVEAVSMPLYANHTVTNSAGGYVYAGTSAQTTYPVVGSNWSAYDPDGNGTGFGLPLSTDLNGDANYALWINVNDDPVPAIFQFRVTLTTGAVAVYTTRLFYVFNTPPKVITVTDNLGASTTINYPVSAGDPGTLTNPVTINPLATTLTLTGDRPLHRAGGSEVCGMSLNAHVFYIDATGNQINTPAVQTTLIPDTGLCVPAVNLSLPLTVSTIFPTTVSGTPVAKYQVDFTVSGANGDNSAEIFYFSY